MISRKYAERYFPDFVDFVDKEVKEAGKRAREAIENKTIFIARNSSPKVDTEKWKSVYTSTRVVASLANQGLSKQRIAKATGLKMNTVRHYLQNARREGLIPEGLVVRTKDRGLPSRQERNGR